MVGLLLIVCALLYRLSYIGVYRLGDDFVMDKIDEMISNEQLFDSFIDDKDAEETKGFRFYGRKPESGEFRRTLVESFIEDDEETFVAR
ncbi:hypothetical protein [Chryseolinea sp. H1M3-3]|uniref:hypothetical protein n=1 Tax=Chryseolinea sp. H1M3-3 TaxID=3034144 RepID=UPI0023EA978A|nr:hypothetical protein [Chryseolinea sp. H1M3-3]